MNAGAGGGQQKLKKVSSESMGQLNTLNSGKSVNKAKKKLCLMSENGTGDESGLTSINTNYLLNDLQNVQLKPISNKSKRGLFLFPTI